jgi:serine protease Do
VLPDVPHDELLNEFLERLSWQLEPDFENQVFGTGFVIRADGYILTNFHVVEEAFNEEVVVRLADGRELPGRVAGVDPETDLALVKVEAADLPQVRIGDPRRLQPGEWVATIGAPFGFERSVAAGIVSATRRSVPAVAQIPFIQTDVATNPGHSGGPLFNLRGEVVGVNSLIFSNTGGSIGVSFAIPIDVAMDIAQELRLHGEVKRGRIGVHLQEVSAELARAFRLPSTQGAVITQVEKGTPAERAGLRAGDVILRFAGKSAPTHAELAQQVTATPPGTAVAIDLVRYGEPRQVTLRVAASRSAPLRSKDAGGTDRFGFVVAPLGEARRKRMGLDGGLLVQRAEGAARRAGLVPGDVILSVNGANVRNAEGFRAALEQGLPGDSLALLVVRASSRAFVPLRVP